MNKILLKNETKSILALCKTDAKKDDKLEFVELGRDMFRNKPEILNKYFKNSNGQDCYYANLLAFKDRKSLMTLKELKAELKHDFGCEVSLKGYRYDPEHYMFDRCETQMEYEEDLYRFQDEEPVVEPYTEGLDFKAVNSLMIVLDKALKQRYIMIFNLETVPGMIKNGLDCHFKGVSCYQTNLALHAKIDEVRAMLENKEVTDWLKTGASDMSLDKEDYIETYQRVLRTMTDCRENLEEYRDSIHNEYDLFEDDIIENNYLECDSYNENVSCGDEEDDYLD